MAAFGPVHSISWRNREIFFRGLTASSVKMPSSTSLVGRRVQIRALKGYGSARVLDGLQGTVTAAHPIALNWVIVVLDPNARTLNFGRYQMCGRHAALRKRH